MSFKKLKLCEGYYSGKGKVMMREAWILMEASTGEWTADGDNLVMVVFFSLFDDKNHNVGANSKVSNGLIKISIKYTSSYCKLSMFAAMVSHDHWWWWHGLFVSKTDHRKIEMHEEIVW